MKTYTGVIFCSCLMLITCQQPSTYVPEGLRKLSDEELIERIQKGDMGNPSEVVLKNEKGEIISRDSILRMKNVNDYWTTPYVNDSGKVVEAIIRRATPADKKLRDTINQIISRGPDVEIVDVDCTKKQQFLQAVFESDQAGGRKVIDHETDQKNLGLIVSFLEKCGVPSKEEVDDVQMAAIWAVLQHGSLRYRKKYLPMLEAAAKRGDISKGIIVMMKDRNLMEEGKPQIYGTQVMNGQLYDLYQPEFVNKRRKEVGLGPIEEYLKRFNIDFNVPQKE